MWYFTNDRPIYVQLIEQIGIRIVNGSYAPGEKLPSVRDMASEVGANPNTVQRAYAALEEKGYITTITGRGNYVSEESNWKDSLYGEVLSELKETVKRVMAAGVEREEAMKCVREVYERD